MMPRNVFESESRSVQWHVDRLGVDKVKVAPTVAELIDATRPAHVSRGDWLVLCAIRWALIAPIVDLRLDALNDAVGALRGAGAPPGATREAEPPGAPSGAVRPVREAGNATTVPVSDGEMRRLMGAPGVIR